VSVLVLYPLTGVILVVVFVLNRPVIPDGFCGSFQLSWLFSGANATQEVAGFAFGFKIFETAGMVGGVSLKKAQHLGALLFSDNFFSDYMTCIVIRITESLSLCNPDWLPRSN
jgi:hypothetical protein